MQYPYYAIHASFKFAVVFQVA